VIEQTRLGPLNKHDVAGFKIFSKLEIRNYWTTKLFFVLPKLLKLGLEHEARETVSSSQQYRKQQPLFLFYYCYSFLTK
jgi:hypothetical protein